jgi:transposase
LTFDAKDQPPRVAVRARIILLLSEGKSNKDVAEILRVTPKTVARWKNRFLLSLNTKILRWQTDKYRRGRPRISVDVAYRLKRVLLKVEPPNGKRWTYRALAKKVGISEASVRKMITFS